MSDNTVTSMSNSTLNPINISATINVKKAEEKSDAGEILQKQNEESAKRREKMQDVIGVSKDGDTAQASKVSKDRLKEEALGKITENLNTSKVIEHNEKSAIDRASDSKEEAAKRLSEDKEIAEEAREKAIENRKEYLEELLDSEQDDSNSVQNSQNQVANNANNNDNIQATNTSSKKVSYEGYSDEQLRAMYLDGSISRYEYDNEMKERASEHFKETKGEKVFREGIVRAIDKDRTVTQKLENIDTVYSDQASETLSEENRMAILNAAENMRNTLPQI